MCLKLSGFQSQYANKVYMLCQSSLRPIRFGLTVTPPHAILQNFTVKISNDFKW